ncbi:MAG TPA: PIG-L family deacetylase [Steroidobacteraceae bacterium]|jgi:LmbE family N-acetylglucosaminyl deacetylase|nr:PIG-L family deacetylase [Steroidobacteraceae bacterium]
MRALALADHAARERISILCLGAHCDDIDIGCGGSLLALLRRYRADVTWAVFNAHGAREQELRASARRFLRGAVRTRLITRDYRDGFFPALLVPIKEDFETLKQSAAPDLVFTHHRADRHQDHQLIAQLTWQTFRRDLILEYEIAKYEGDLTTPCTYVELLPAQAERKIEILLDCYRSQRSKPWFTADTFRALMRLRGVESGGKSGWAEGFHAAKVLLA